LRERDSGPLTRKGSISGGEKEEKGRAGAAQAEGEGKGPTAVRGGEKKKGIGQCGAWKPKCPTLERKDSLEAKRLREGEGEGTAQGSR